MTVELLEDVPRSQAEASRKGAGLDPPNANPSLSGLDLYP